MNFILNNKLASFLIFIILYCLFNYQLKEGMNADGQIVIDRATGNRRLATKKDIAMRNSIEQNAIEHRAVDEAATKEVQRDREIALDAKTPTQQKTLESSALGRSVDAIDGKAGEETEQAAAAQMAAIVDKPRAPKAETGARGEALGSGGKMAQEAAAAARKLSEMAMASTMKDVARAQNVAIENLQSSVSQSKNMDKKLSGIAKSYGLADQGEGFSGVVGAGSEVSGSTKNSNELIKQRDRVASKFGCEERCRYLYDDETGFVCDSGNCICRIRRDKKHLLELPGSAEEELLEEEVERVEEEVEKVEEEVKKVEEKEEVEKGEKVEEKSETSTKDDEAKIDLKTAKLPEKPTKQQLDSCKAARTFWAKRDQNMMFRAMALKAGLACQLPPCRGGPDNNYTCKTPDAVTEAFTSTPSKYVYRIHGKCGTTEINQGEA